MVQLLGLEGMRLGRYRLRHRLGEGGMAEVYLAYDGQMRREVAIKVVEGGEADLLTRFQREVEVIGSLTHEHILPVFDYGEQDGCRYLVMQYVEGATLGERLDAGPLAVGEIGPILMQVASALQFAHERGVTHRDIKPSNILLRDSRFAYLADFGLAKPMDSINNLTRTGYLLGTPEYMAPELAQEGAGPSIDIYALGVVLYQMLTGQVPFTGNSVFAIYWKHLQEQPLPPSLLNPAVPSQIEQVVLRALEKDPRQRFKTPMELAHAYQLARQSAQQSPTLYGMRRSQLVGSSPISSRPRPQWRPTLVLLLLLSFMFITVFSLALFFLNSNSQAQQAIVQSNSAKFHSHSSPDSELRRPVTPVVTLTSNPHLIVTKMPVTPRKRPTPTPTAKPTPTPTPTLTPTATPTPAVTPTPTHKHKHKRGSG